MDNSKDPLTLEFENDKLKDKLKTKEEEIEILQKELKKKKNQLASVKEALEESKEYATDEVEEIKVGEVPTK